jgi:hypothetical protein
MCVLSLVWSTTLLLFFQHLLKAVLDPLTSNTYRSDFLEWTPAFHLAFDSIKKLVLSSDCLTFINHDDPGDNKIFVTTDTSNVATGAVLLFGPTWDSAQLVAFDSKVLFFICFWNPTYIPVHSSRSVVLYIQGVNYI